MNCMVQDGPGRRFDGFVFLGGGDWWYHNRGHYCMQMARYLSDSHRVLYVNSIGVRTPRPSEGRMFLRRVTRKVRSWLRGFRRESGNLGVLSPVAVPGRLGMRLSRRLLVSQVRSTGRRMGIRRPVVWVVCPPGAEILRDIDAAGLVYQRTDRWEEFPGCDRAQILEYHRLLKDRADLTLYCSTLLFQRERETCNGATYLDHGVDFDLFERAGTGGGAREPADVARIPRPRVGFIGGIDSHTFDSKLFHGVAEELDEASFVLVGSCSIDEPWRELPNVHLLGQRPYEEIARYMAACDVLIMPWNDNEWIEACNPVKLKEYLAVGRPVVTTWFEELRRYEGHVRVARGANRFAEQIREALRQGVNAEESRERVRGETWKARAKQLENLLEQRGLKPAP